MQGLNAQPEKGPTYLCTKELSHVSLLDLEALPSLYAAHSVLSRSALGDGVRRALFSGGDNLRATEFAECVAGKQCRMCAHEWAMSEALYSLWDAGGVCWFRDQICSTNFIIHILFFLNSLPFKELFVSSGGNDAFKCCSL